MRKGFQYRFPVFLCLNFTHFITMKKQFGAICLLAGTAIGSGMLSLPIVLAKCGIVNSCLLFIFFAFLTYISSLIRCDLNINSNATNSLPEVGEIFGGHYFKIAGEITIKLLMFSLISAYIFGLSSVISSHFGYNPVLTSLGCIVFAGTILYFPAKTLICINQQMFIFMMATLIILVGFLTYYLPINELPPCFAKDFSFLHGTLPLIFTSFGFQGSLHNMTKHVQNDKKMIQQACLWGSIIPAIIYAFWTICILTIVFNSSPTFFRKMVLEPVEVGDLVKILTKSANASYIHWSLFIVSTLSILTSLIGVMLSLFEPFVKKSSRTRPFLKTTSSVLKTLTVPSIVALSIPNAFIRVLNISGILLAIIAIIIPCLLHLKIQNPCDSTIIRSRITVISTFAIGVLLLLTGI